MLRHVLPNKKRGGFKERRGDVRAAPGLFSLAQGSQDADDAEHAAGDVDDRRPGTHRTLRQAGHVGEPAHHLRHFVERGAVFIRAAQKTFEAAIDETLVARFERFKAEPELVERARAKVLDQHIGAVDQAQRKRLARLGLDIKADAALVAVVHGEVARARTFEAARLVAADRFDLDHIGTKVGEYKSRRRSHDHVRELNDGDAAQGRHERCVQMTTNLHKT